MKRFLFWTLLVLVILAIAVLSSLPFLVRSEYLEGLINQAIQKQTAYSIAFDSIRISFFPTPVAHLDKIELTPKEGQDLPLVRAERASFRPSLFSILIGKPALAHGSARDADVHYTLRDKDFVKTISLTGSNIDFWNVTSNKPIRFKIKGKFLSDSDNIRASGTIKTNFDPFKTKGLNVNAELEVSSLELSRLVQWWAAPLPLDVKQGILSFSAQLLKTEGTSYLDIKSTARLNQFAYQIPPKETVSLPADYQLELSSSLDLDTGILDVKSGSLTAPFGGSIELDGRLNIFTGSLNEVLVKTQSLQLESLPQYLLSLERVLPINWGFSGATQVDFYLKGEPELFLINLNVDLTSTNLAYSKYFSKPSGIPLTFKSDMKLATGRALRGDFAMDFEQASLKGSLVGVDLVTGDGEITVLTNKFRVDGWQKYFPLLRQFELGGDIKILTNIKGNLSRFNEARVMNNITLDRLWARSTTGAEIKNLSGSMDSGPLDSELKDLHFEIGNNAFSIEGKMFQQPEAKWLVNVHAPRIDVSDLTSQARKTAEAVDPSSKINWDSVENFVRQVFSPAETVEQFDAQLAFGGKKFLIPQIRFSVFGGSVSGRAAFDSAQAVPTSFAELDIQRLSLSRMQSSSPQPVMLGNLFLYATLTEQGSFDEGWLNRLQGKGSISVTNGELRTVDLLGGLGQIAQLAPLESLKSGVTRFDDIRGDFEIHDRKLTTQNAMLVSEDFQVEAQGDVGFDSMLNFRLSIFLSPALSQRISPRIGENARLGPIPVLIVGSAAQPQVRQDPLLITSFLQSLVAEQFSKITSGFLKSKQTTSANFSQAGADQSLSQNQPKSRQSQNLDEQLIQSGFGLLEQFLSQKKSDSPPPR